MKIRKIDFILIIILLLIQAQTISQVFQNPVVTIIGEGFQFVEGPVWIPGDTLLFSDIPANTVYAWTEEGGTKAWLDPSGNSNGLAMDAENNLILCQHGLRQVARLESDGSFTPMATHYNGKRLNSPNDLDIHSDGSVFFTDPPYGLNDLGETSELGFYGIYRLSSAGEVQLLDSSLNRPNGIALSPDETRLYVSDSEARRIFVWDVVDDSTLANKQEFAYQEPFGYTDGMKVDSEGYLYSTGPVGVWVYAPDGRVIDTIPVPGQTSNCAWGGPDGRTLFVTSGNAVYAITEGQAPDALQPGRAGAQLLPAYPNPCRGSITFPYLLSGNLSINIAIHSLTGNRSERIVKAETGFGIHAFTWQLRTLEPGNYVMSLTVEGSGISQSCRFTVL